MSEVRNKTKTPISLPPITNHNHQHTSSHISFSRTPDPTHQNKPNQAKGITKKEKIISHFLIRYLERK